MASDKVRLGIIGANPAVGWGPRAHLPAAAASPDVELTAVCTTREESATASARKYGAKYEAMWTVNDAPWTLLNKHGGG